MIKKPSLKIYSSFSTNIIPRLQTSNSSLTKERARTKFPLTFRILSKFIPKISRFYTGNATTKGSRVLHPKTFIPKSIRIPAKKHDHPLPFSFSRCRFKNQFQPKEKKNPSLVPFSLLRTFWFEPPSPSFPLQKLVPRIVLVKETGWQEGKVRATSSSNRFLQLTSPSRFFFYEPFNPPWDQRNSLSRTSSLWQDAPTCASWTSFNCCLRTRLFYVFARLPGRNLAEDRLNLCRIMLFLPPSLVSRARTRLYRRFKRGKSIIEERGRGFLLIFWRRFSSSFNPLSEQVGLALYDDSRGSNYREESLCLRGIFNTGARVTFPLFPVNWIINGIRVGDLFPGETNN